MKHASDLGAQLTELNNSPVPRRSPCHRAGQSESTVPAIKSTGSGRLASTGDDPLRPSGTLSGQGRCAGTGHREQLPEPGASGPKGRRGKPGTRPYSAQSGAAAALIFAEEIIRIRKPNGHREDATAEIAGPGSWPGQESVGSHKNHG